MRGILLEGTDIQVKDGYMVLGDNTMDMIENIVDSNRGEWKNDVYLGVGIKNMVAANKSDVSISREVVENLKRGGIEYKKVRVNNGEIEIEI